MRLPLLFVYERFLRWMAVCLLYIGLVGAAEVPGIKGEYFSGTGFTNPVMIRIDPCIDFDWAREKPENQRLGCTRLDASDGAG